VALGADVGGRQRRLRPGLEVAVAGGLAGRRVGLDRPERDEADGGARRVLAGAELPGCIHVIARARVHAAVEVSHEEGQEHCALRVFVAVQRKRLLAEV